MHDNTDCISNDSVKPKLFSNVNPRKSNSPSSPKFRFPSHPNLIINHKVLIQIMNLPDPVPHVIIEEI